MTNGLKKRLEDWQTDNEFEEVTVCALLDITDKIEKMDNKIDINKEKKKIDWKIWGMFSVPILIILIDKIL